MSPDFHLEHMIMWLYRMIVIILLWASGHLCSTSLPCRGIRTSKETAAEAADAKRGRGGRGRGYSSAKYWVSIPFREGETLIFIGCFGGFKSKDTALGLVA